jgi:hypothetical protein
MIMEKNAALMSLANTRSISNGMRYCRSILALILLASSPFIAFADSGALYISPETSQHSDGDVFDLQVLVDSGGVKINAAEADIAFDPASVEVENLSVDDSLLDIWPSPPVFSNKDGYVRFSGLMKSPYMGSDGKLATITLKTLRNIPTNVRFNSGAILASNGQSSNIISSMRSALISIEPKEILPPPPPAPIIVDRPAPVKPSAPTFTSVQSSVNAGDHFALQGTADPNTKVVIYAAHNDGSPIRRDISSDGSGAFSYLSDTTEAGVYTVYANAVSQDGIVSDQSRSVSVTVLSAGLAAAAFSGVSIAYELMPYALLLVVAGLGGGYIIHRHRVAMVHRERPNIF